MVVLDFSRCDPNNGATPGGLYFPNIWRKCLQGKTVTIDKTYMPISQCRRYLMEEKFEDVGSRPLWFDEFCILDQRSFFDTSGLEELI